MYPSNDSTQAVVYRHNDNRRAWLAVAGGVVAVLVVTFLIMAACNGRDSEDGTPLGAGAASPATSGVGASGSAGGDPEQTDEGGGEPAGGGQGSGDSGDNPGDGDNGDNGGDGDSGGDGGDGDDGGGEPDDPGPLGIGVSVNAPPPAIGCTAKGRIDVTGGEYPTDVTYQWYRMQALPPHNILVPLTFGDPQTLTVEQPGEFTVTSPQFPDDAPDNRVMLVVTSEAGGSSDWVTYPKCVKLVQRVP